MQINTSRQDGGRLKRYVLSETLRIETGEKCSAKYDKGINLKHLDALKVKEM